ncbi:hypothetical protein HYFRA_00012845 [Hymenoscyphus fraxineus]|uniref:Uncharacterized protein n=1 Tax=Hymenoscyphus fraxineus TaxID=746836 RepID=A0A9N9L4R2_9HELO|nr:hypothetical protein HYFRA_00012845 [Hymenoscyphus fraxineus]
MRVASHFKTEELRKAEVHVVGDAMDREVAHEDNVPNRIIRFTAARYNYAHEEAIREAVARRKPTNTDTYRLHRNQMLKIARECQHTSTDALLKHVRTNEERVTRRYGASLFRLLDDTQLRELFGVILDTCPITIMSNLKKKEAQIVDFAAIWVADTPDRLRWRMFFRNMYVDMMLHSWSFRVGVLGRRDCKQLLFKLWKLWPQQPKVDRWGVGRAWDLPGVASGVMEESRRLENGTYLEDPDSGAGEYISPFM